MINCPNKSSNNWKSLYELVPHLANHIWDKLNGEIDKDGKPLEHKDLFDRLLKKNKDNYKKTYLDYLNKLASGDIEETPITKEDIKVDNSRELKEVLSESRKPIESKSSSSIRKSEIRDQAIKSLKFKLELSQKKKSTRIDPEKAQDFIKKLNDLEVDQALTLFTNQAEKNTNSIYSEFLDMVDKLNQIEKGTLDLDKKIILNPSKISNWIDYLSAYDSINDYRTSLTMDGSLYKNPELKKILDNIISKKEEIQKFYDVISVDINSELLEPHFDGIRKDFEIQVAKDYDKLSKEEQSKISKESYVQVQKELKQVDLKQETILSLRRELQKATSDIGLARRWVDNVLDSPNAVVGAVGQIMSFKEMEVHGKRIEARDKIIPVLERLEKFKRGKTKLIDLYEDILDNGKLIDRFGYKFHDEYDKLKQEVDNDKNLESDERKDRLTKWVRSNTEFRDKEYLEDKWRYIDSLYKTGEISDFDYKSLEWNEALSPWNKKLPNQMFEDNEISESTADLISQWHMKNVWNYRDPSSKWSDQNTKWNKFQKMIDMDKITKTNERNPIVEFYDLYKQLEQAANDVIPASMRLRNGQLPGVFKTSDERLQSGESFSSIAKREMYKTFNFVVNEDQSRGNKPLIDERGNKRYFIPLHYTDKLDMKDQSFDLASNIFKFYSMAMDYESKNSIYPQMEMIRHSLKTRKPEMDSNKKELRFNNRLAEQFNDWFEMVFYGINKKDEGTFKFLGLTIDKAKGLDFIGKMTSYNIMSLNARSAVSIGVISEALQAGEAFAGQFMGIKNYHKAHTYYIKNYAGIIADVGQRKKINIVNLLLDKFKVDAEQMDSRFRDNTMLKKTAKSSSLFFLQNSVWNYENTKVFLGMLDKKIAYDKDGNKLGSMLEQYTKNKNGELTLNSKVDLNKSEWNQLDQSKFGNKVQYVIEGIQGNYTELGKTAMQRVALGRMGLMFRKYIIPGIEKRYKPKEFTQRVGDYTEGYYRTTAKYLSNLVKEFKTYQFAVMGEEWDKLSHMEKSNIIRTVSEVGFLIVATTLGYMMTSGGKDDKDHKWFYDFMAYQTLRLKSEMLFYTNPVEAMKIMRSPMATMSMFESVGKALYQLTNPMETYKTGGHGHEKGELKYKKIMIDLIPAMRSFYQTKNIKDQVNFMK
jgi:phage anti-repressor protein